MKHFINALFIVAVTAIGSVAVSAQVRVITQSEYDAAVNAAEAKTEATFPRIVTDIYKAADGDEYWSLERHESAKRRSTTHKNISGGIVRYSKYVFFDGETLEREDDGVWAPQKLTTTFGGDGPSIKPIKFTVENVKIAGKILKLYTKVEIEDGEKELIYKSKIDALGRLVEYNSIAAGTDLKTYEYPKALAPIKKPRLGSKDDIAGKP